MTTVADTIAEALMALGIVEIFGMDSPESFYRAATDVGMRQTTIRDERSAAAMADAYARTTGRVAICTAIQGPGATNLVTTLAEAHAASSPVLAIISDTAAGSDGQAPFQGFSEDEALAPVTKAVHRLTRADQAAEVTVRAVRTATSGRPGPVALLLPGDILNLEIAPSPPRLEAIAPSWPDDEALRTLHHRLLDAERPLVVAGELAARAPGGLDKLLDALAVPAVMTTLGHGGVSDDNPWALGLASAYTSATRRGARAFSYASTADLVVVVGGRLDALDTDGWRYPAESAAVVWVAPVDVEPPEHVTVDTVIRCDVGPFAQRLIEVAGPGGRREAQPLGSEPRSETFDGDSRPLQPGAVAAEAVASAARTKSPLVVDASFSSAWGLALTPSQAGKAMLLAPRGMGGLGWSTPAAIGASIASGRHRVVTLLGDGALGFSVMELETAVRAGAWITVVLLDNQMLGFQHHWEKLRYGRTFAPELGAVDHAALARALGASSERLEHLSEVREYLRETEASPGVHLLDVITDNVPAAPISWFEPVEESVGVH